MMIRSTLIPINRDVSGSCEVACIARPSRVRLTKKNMKTVQIANATRVNSAARWISTPPMLKAGPVT